MTKASGNADHCGKPRRVFGFLPRNFENRLRHDAARAAMDEIASNEDDPYPDSVRICASGAFWPPAPEAGTIENMSFLGTVESQERLVPDVLGKEYSTPTRAQACAARDDARSGIRRAPRFRFRKIIPGGPLPPLERLHPHCQIFPAGCTRGAGVPPVPLWEGQPLSLHGG